MIAINIILPNQLFEESALLNNGNPCFIIEEFLFFSQFKFHKQKIFFHRCSMLNYSDYVKGLGNKLSYVNANQRNSDLRTFIKELDNSKINEINIIDPDDNWIEKRIKEECQKANISLIVHENPSFITNKNDLEPFFRADKKKFFQTTFYKAQRQKFNLLMDDQNKPIGGKWTYDDENRLKFPKNKSTPTITSPKATSNHQNAMNYVINNFSENPGSLNEIPIYPTDFSSAKLWLSNFLKTRFKEFGPYEDAVLKNESIINHSLLSPLMNSGLLTPNYILSEIQKHTKTNNIPINSVEGLIRQIIGWREFIRGVYYAKGTEERTKNFWKFDRKIPVSFYNGTTGIEPLDDTINKINKTGYANHIERLMIVGNFMLLCEFDPDEVYQWFMELFIDAYDWVMVPNVYGMSQFADGGMMSTKPYIGSSNYIIKMSDYKKGDWCAIWDALFWNFMDKQRDFFLKNPRMRMLISTFDKMEPLKKEKHLKTADDFLKKLQ